MLFFTNKINIFNKIIIRIILTLLKYIIIQITYDYTLRILNIDDYIIFYLINLRRTPVSFTFNKNLIYLSTKMLSMISH